MTTSESEHTPAKLEARLVALVKDLEALVEDGAQMSTPLGERLRERLDAAMPALDDMQDLLGRPEPKHEGDEGEAEHHGDSEA